MPVMRQGGSSRVLLGNLPLFATFSILIRTPPQRWQGRDGRADEAAAVLMRQCLHADQEVWDCEASWQHADASGGDLGRDASLPFQRWPNTKEIKCLKCMSGQS